MTLKNKKVLIIIPIVIVFVILILAVLYFTTDFMKSNKTLFIKYISQNVDAAKIVFDNKSEKEYSNILRQNKYESVAELKSTYTEKIDTSEENKNNDINKLKAIINTQSEYLNNYLYKDIKITYNDSNILKAEYIHDNEKYGIRFPERFNQFLAVENHDLKQIGSNASLSEEITDLIPDNIQEIDYNNMLIFTDEELQNLKNKYLDILSLNVPNDKYSKQKNALITVGENSFNTTAYSITLTQEQANDIYIKILEQLKDDEIIINKLSQLEPMCVALNMLRKNEEANNVKYLEEHYVKAIEQRIEEIRQNNIGTNQVKCTVYQTNENTVRTQITEEARELTIDFDISDRNNVSVKIYNNNANQEQANERTVVISKKNDNQESTLSFELENIQGNNTSSLKINRNININESEVNAQTVLNYNDGEDNLLEVTYSDNSQLNKEFNRTINLDDNNSVILNNYQQEMVTKWINEVKTYLQQIKTNNATIIKNVENIKLISMFLNISQEAIETESDITTEVDRSRFNVKFEFYTGKEKKTEEIKKLLDEAKNSIKNAQVSYSNEGSTQGTKKLESIKLEVSDNADNPKLAESVKELLEDSKTYTVEIEKNSNDIVTGVKITVNN
ncbi:MAG: hypothetical protein IKF17_01080 [Clostridia bacterium]|nr:hypothetical protein [Clostridia bacterium]